MNYHKIESNSIYPKLDIDFQHSIYTFMDIAHIDEFKYCNISNLDTSLTLIQKRKREQENELNNENYSNQNEFKEELLKDINSELQEKHKYVLDLIDSFNHKINSKYSNNYTNIGKSNNNENYNLFNINESTNFFLSLTEKSIIKEKNNLILCGRSGTGKTTCILYKMFFSLMNYNILIQEKIAGKYLQKNLVKIPKKYSLKIVFTSFSHFLTDEIKKKYYFFYMVFIYLKINYIYFVS